MKTSGDTWSLVLRDGYLYIKSGHGIYSDPYHAQSASPLHSPDLRERCGVLWLTLSIRNLNGVPRRVLIFRYPLSCGCGHQAGRTLKNRDKLRNVWRISLNWWIIICMKYEWWEFVLMTTLTPWAVVTLEAHDQAEGTTAWRSRKRKREQMLCYSAFPVH